MCVDYAHDRAIAELLTCEVNRCLRRFGYRQCIDDNETGITQHKRHICIINASDLVDPVRNLEEPRFRHQPGIAP